MLAAVEFQIGDSRYEVEYTFDPGFDHSVVIDQNQHRFGFRYKDGRLSHSTRPKGFGEEFMNDVMQRLYDIESAKSRYVDDLWFFCYIRRIGVNNNA